MAFNSHSIFYLSIIILVLAPSTFARPGDSIPSDLPDRKQPDSFIPYDGTVLIPGFGRVVVPKLKKGFNPFTYNPVTGAGGGPATGLGGGVGGIPGGTPSYVPGGDDTFVPNPGFEVPSGGGIPAPTVP